jgi:predicted nucleic acid-binding protein
MIVSDAGPIVVFARIGRLSLLHDVTGALLIPDAVHSEIFVKKGAMPGASEVAQATWIQRVSVANRSIVDRMPTVLHEGEREAIALAKERGAQLLIDEIRARRAASDQGIEVIGTLRILDHAKRSGHIDLAQPIIAQMLSQGYRFDRALILRFLEIVGEG